MEALQASLGRTAKPARVLRADATPLRRVAGRKR